MTSNIMSVQEGIYKVLPRARKQLLNEFKLKEATLSLIDNQLAQEPYNMITGYDGHRKPSTRWSRTVEQIWAWNNAAPDSKGRYNFIQSMIVDGHAFNRRDIIVEPIFRADLHNLIRGQMKKLGYDRCFTKVVTRTDPDGEEYNTVLIQVPVSSNAYS